MNYITDRLSDLHINAALPEYCLHANPEYFTPATFVPHVANALVSDRNSRIEHAHGQAILKWLAKTGHKMDGK